MARIAQYVQRNGLNLAALQASVDGLLAWRQNIVPHGHGQKRSTDRLRARQLLHGLIHQHLDAGELQALCFDIGITYDDLEGGHDDRILQLIMRAIREGALPRLLARLRELRPGVDWPDVE